MITVISPAIQEPLRKLLRGIGEGEVYCPTPTKGRCMWRSHNGKCSDSLMLDLAAAGIRPETILPLWPTELTSDSMGVVIRIRDANSGDVLETFKLNTWFGHCASRSVVALYSAIALNCSATPGVKVDMVMDLIDIMPWERGSYRTSLDMESATSVTSGRARRLLGTEHWRGPEDA